jgi:RHS repeat-associated protein
MSMKRFFSFLMLVMSFGGAALAQQGPGWINAGSNELPELEGAELSVSAYESPAAMAMMAMMIGEGAAAPPPPILDAGNAADVITPEIQALADGLRGDPAAVFQWVRENIAYSHYHGLRKGAALTLLEGSGNDADTSALLVALLRASGVPARYRSGFCAVPLSAEDDNDLEHWLGIDPVAVVAESFLLNRGTPVTDLFREEIPAGTPTGRYFLRRVWVEADIGGASSWFDPSFKTMTHVAGVNLPAASGYDRAALLTSAGGTVAGAAVSGLNETALANHLRDRTTALVSHIQTNLPNEKPVKLTGGYEKAALPASSFPLLYAETPVVETWEMTPAGMFSTLRMQMGSIDHTVKLAELGGRRLSLVFDGTGKGQVYLDDTLLVQEAAGGTGSVPMQVWFDHPGGADLDQDDAGAPKSYLRTGSYALLYGCEVSQRWLRARQEKLEAYRAAGLADTSREVRTETLNVMGINWLLQTQLAGRMLADIADVAQTYHHRFGRMADEFNGTTGGYYVDVWLQFYGYAARRMGQDVATVAAADGFVASAMEHGVIAQTQEGAPAASTVKLGSVANATGKKLFLADTANWGTVQPQLMNYGTADATAISAAITAGKTVLLPEAGNLAVQQWQGSGYVTWKNSGGAYEVGMLISGGYSGGYSGYIAPASTYSVITGQQYSAPKLNYTPVTHAVTTGGDPVDMATGQFVHEATDLVVGGGAAPRGLTFSRNYHGGRRQRNDAGVGYGWNHNLNVLAVPRSDVENALGLGTPQQAAAVVVGLHAAWDVFKNRADVKDWATSLLIAKWIVDRLQDNAVSVALGDRVVEFHVQPDGSYTPPPGVTLSLTKDGSGNFVVQERHGNTHQFNAEGKLATITDLWGRVQTFVYASGKLATVTDCYGRVLTLNYTGELLTSVGDGLGRSVDYTHDAGAKTLTQVTDVEGKDSYFVYDASKRMTALRNHALETLVENVAFDSQDRVITQHSAGDAGKVWRYYYAPGQTIEEDPLEGRVTHHFDEKKRNIGRTDALGQHTTVVYDGQDHAVEQRSPLGHTRKAVYDANQNLTASLDALNENNTAEYDAQQRVIRAVDRNGKETLVQNYNAFHQPQRVVDATGLITDTTYHASGDGAGMPHTVTVGGALKATHTYTNKGELYRSTFPGGDYIEHGYNAWGDVISVRNVRGFVTTSTYNNRRQVLTTTAPGSQAGDPASVVTRTYDDNGDLETVVSPRGHTTTYTYTVQGKPLTSMLPGGAVTTNHYDERDWLDEVTDATGRKVMFTLNAAGQRTAVRDALNHEVVTDYDDDGRAWQSTDPLTHATQTEFTARGEAEFTYFADHTLANPDYIGRVFDAAGRVTLMQNRRYGHWLFGYDDAGRSTFTKSPLLRQWTQDYDTQGRAQTVTEPSGQNVTQAYDARDRVTTRTYKNANGSTAATVSHTFDANGNVLTTTEGANVLTRTFDQRDRVLSYTNAQSEQIGYRYDASGNLVQLIYPGGKTVMYAYDSRERLTTITDWSARETTLTWDDAGRLLKVSRPNGTYRDYQYDAAGRMIQVAERKANKRAICVVRFELDAAGRPTKKLTLPVPQAASVPAVTATFDADNRMETLLGYGIPHDADGNMQAIFLPFGVYPVGELYWDTRNRLTDVWEQVWAGQFFLGYNQTQFTYDAEGNRTHKTFNGATTRYTVNPHGLNAMSEVLIEHKPDNTKRWYVWGGPAGLLYESQTDSGGTETNVRYYHSDQVGSMLALTDASANVTGRVEYSPYGMITHTSGVIDTPYLFNGAFGVQTDAETGLLHMRARYYHPWLGRFLSEDPIQFSGGNNWYAFTSGDPIFGSDPSGLTERSGLGNRDWHQVTGRNYAAEARQAAALMAYDPLLAIEGVSSREYSTMPAIDPIDAVMGLFISASRSFAKTAAVETGGAGTTRLFRAVENDELADVMRYGDYNIHPNSTFKRFAFDEGSLDDFIEANPGRDYTKTFIDVPTENLGQMYRHADPGGVGKSIGIDVYENPQFYDWFEKVNILGQ